MNCIQESLFLGKKNINKKTKAVCIEFLLLNYLCFIFCEAWFHFYFSKKAFCCIKTRGKLQGYSAKGE